MKSPATIIIVKAAGITKMELAPQPTNLDNTSLCYTERRKAKK
jgi:hypothetical protein